MNSINSINSRLLLFWKQSDNLDSDAGSRSISFCLIRRLKGLQKQKSYKFLIDNFFGIFGLSGLGPKKWSKVLNSSSSEKKTVQWEIYKWKEASCFEGDINSNVEMCQVVLKHFLQLWCYHDCNRGNYIVSFFNEKSSFIRELSIKALMQKIKLVILKKQ